MNYPATRYRVLIFRLSAMGDIILCTSALAAVKRMMPDAEVDWVISSGWAPLLQHDRRLNQLISFDRRAGFIEWHRLCSRLFASGYNQVIDLHGSLRTRYAWFYFLFRSWAGLGRSVKWNALSKSRVRRLGFFAFKSLWPRFLRPSARGGLAVRAAQVAGGGKQDRSDLTSLLRVPVTVRVEEWLNLVRSDGRGFLTVMPGSAWPGKRWPVGRVAEVLKTLALPVVILGTDRDRECHELYELLSQTEIRTVAAFHGVDLSETAHLIHASHFLLSNDTGLVHLAEALGKPVVVTFGPTDHDLGFGPWRKESRAVGAKLWCRPCSKDGTGCFRRGDSRFLCMKRLHPSVVARACTEVLSEVESSLPRSGASVDVSAPTTDSVLLQEESNLDSSNAAGQRCQPKASLSSDTATSKKSFRSDS